jgi:hypothetical protein
MQVELESDEEDHFVDEEVQRSVAAASLRHRERASATM